MLNEGLEMLGAKESSYNRHWQSHVYSEIFYDSGLEEIVLPSTLKSINSSTFTQCGNLKIVWVEDGCTADIRSAVGDHVGALRRPTKPEGTLLYDLRR